MKIEVDAKNFEDWLESKELKDRTLFEYMSYFKKFDFNQFNQEYITRFVNQFKGFNFPARSFLMNLFKYIQRTTIYPDEVKDHVAKLYIEERTGRKPKRLVRSITEKQMFELSKLMNNARNQLLLYISFYCGLRVSEIFGDDFNSYIEPLSFKHFNFNAWSKDTDADGVLKVIGKGNKQREIPVPSEVMTMVLQYGKSNDSEKQDIIFDIQRRRWDNILNSKAEALFGAGINPHVLRSSCATWLFRKGKDIVEVQKILGHDDISTTQKYLDVYKQTK